MGLEKTFTKTIKSDKPLDTSRTAALKVCSDSKLKIKSDEHSDSGFMIHATEPMKWLTTNWPNNVKIKGEIFDGKTVISLEATSNGTSMTQDKNISDFLNNLSDSLSALVS